MFKTLLMSALLLCATLANAETGSRQFYGYAYDLKSNRYIYTEVHNQKVENGKWMGGTIDYYSADGTLFGKKTLDFTQDPFVPVYRLDLLKSGYMEGVTRASGPIELIKRVSKGEEEETESVKKQPMMVADSGFHSFIVANLPELLSGKKVAFKFVVAGNLDAFKFSVQRIADTQYDGVKAARFIVKPDSLISLLVDPLEVTYNVEQKKLLEYRGVSNVHDPATGKAYVARIVYPTNPPADAPKKLPPLP